jgi:hypothetical protein
MTLLEAVSAALHNRSTETLTSGLTAYMRACEPVRDSRDVLAGFAPFHDCACRLGLDPVVVFATAADAVGGETGELARAFGRRSDVTPLAFGYLAEEGPDGPCYRWATVGPPRK